MASKRPCDVQASNKHTIPRHLFPSRLDIYRSYNTNEQLLSPVKLSRKPALESRLDTLPPPPQLSRTTP